MTGFNPIYIKDQLRGLFRYTEKEGKHHRLKPKTICCFSFTGRDCKKEEELFLPAPLLQNVINRLDREKSSYLTYSQTRAQLRLQLSKSTILIYLVLRATTSMYIVFDLLSINIISKWLSKTGTN